MGSLVTSLGVDPSSDLSVFLFCAIFTFAVVTILWVVGLFQGNHSMMDGWYGFAFAVPALLAYLIVGAQSVTAALLLFMVMLHGGRLGWYLAARWRRYVPELLVEELLTRDGAPGGGHRARRNARRCRHSQEPRAQWGHLPACVCRVARVHGRALLRDRCRRPTPVFPRPGTASPLPQYRGVDTL